LQFDIRDGQSQKWVFKETLYIVVWKFSLGMQNNICSISTTCNTTSGINW
jgi:hypothetical protein